MSLSPGERKLRASLGGLTSWSGMSAAERTTRGRNANHGLWQKYFNATDSALSDAERSKMANSAYRAHMMRLSLKAAKARRLRAEQRERLAKHPGDAA